MSGRTPAQSRLDSLTQWRRMESEPGATARGSVAAPLREPGRHALQCFLATTEPVSGSVGHRLSRAIVHGGAESAGHDDHLSSLYGCVNGRDDILPFIANDRFESNGDPKFAEFVGEEERIGIGSAPDQQFGADGDDFCVECGSYDASFIRFVLDSSRFGIQGCSNRGETRNRLKT